MQCKDCLHEEMCAITHVPESPGCVDFVGWIPCNERMPHVDTRKVDHESVVVIASNGKVSRPMIYERSKVRGKMVYRWKWIWDRIYDENDITHWMPLPAPPNKIRRKTHEN